MNRERMRASKQNGKRMMKKGWNDFRIVPEFELEQKIPGFRYLPTKPDIFYQNNMYSVQVKKNVLRKGRNYTRAMIRRNDAAPVLSWKDVYKIKNEIFGDEVEAVMFLPPKSELIDSANLYWIFIEESNV